MKLFQRRVCLVPTWRAWLILFALMTLFSFAVVSHLYPFLAISEPVGGDILVVEGWIPEESLNQAADIFRKGNYRLIAAIGVPILRGSYLTEYKTTAEVAARILMHYGVSRDSIAVVASPIVRRDRTYELALTLSEWLSDSLRKEIRTFDLFTLGPHARRSRMLFEKAFDGKKPIGIIAAYDRRLTADNWWKSSYGMRSMVFEAVAYFYAKFIFKPF